jgi:hypothetical protein
MNTNGSPFVTEDIALEIEKSTYGFDPIKDKNLIKTHKLICRMYDAKTLQSMLKIGATELYAQKYKITSKAAHRLFVTFGVYNEIDRAYDNPRTYGIMDAFKLAENYIANKRREQKV